VWRGTRWRNSSDRTRAGWGEACEYVGSARRRMLRTLGGSIMGSGLRKMVPVRMWPALKEKMLNDECEESEV
jgi:hypothetical protein